MLNGSGWYPYGWEEWHYAYADDAYWARDWVGAESGSHRAGLAWNFLEGQKAQAVENWVYYSSTGAWEMFMSSHADASAAYCSTGGYLGRF